MKQTNLESITLNSFPSAGWTHDEFAGFFSCNIQWIDSDGQRQCLDVPITKENLPVVQAAQRALVMREVMK